MHKKISGIILATAAAALVLGCAPDTGHPDVEDDVELALEQAGFTDVDVSQDRTTGVVTLSGEVQTDADRQRAEQAARTAAGTLIVSNELAVEGEMFDERAADTGFDRDDRFARDDAWVEDRDREFAMNGDDEIEASFEEMLAARQIEEHEDIKFEANNGVLRLSGEVSSSELRAELEELAAQVPNVRQVVNEVEVAEATETVVGN